MVWEGSAMDNIIIFNRYVHKKDKRMSDIKRERMVEIEKLTSDLLKDLDFTDSPYVDIVSLVKKDKFKVEPVAMDWETTGCLLVNDDTDKTERLITVNTVFKNPEKEPDVVFKKSRFITAHEYGHFILHKKVGAPIYAHRDTDHRTDIKELEADYFARSVLMPIKQFKIFYHVLNEMGGEDETFTIETLSRLFKVTRNKVKKRIGDLAVLAGEGEYTV